MKPVMKAILLLLTLYASTTHAQFTAFAAGPPVSVTAFGAVPNDGIDDTAALKAAMGLGGFTVNVPAGEFTVSTFNVPSNTVLALAPGAVLRDSSQLCNTCRLVNIVGVTNVRITGGQGSAIVSQRSDYTTGELQKHRKGKPDDPFSWYQGQVDVEVLKDVKRLQSTGGLHVCGARGFGRPGDVCLACERTKEGRAMR